MNVRTRIERLEAVHGGDAGLCVCQAPRVVYGNAEYAPPGAERPDAGPETCPHCGRKRQTVRVEYGDLAESIAEAVERGGGENETYYERSLRAFGEALAGRNATETE